MKLYHGTNVDFSVIDLSKSKQFKDFGQGFYLTDIRKQAEELASKKARLFGGFPIIPNRPLNCSALMNPSFCHLSRYFSVTMEPHCALKVAKHLFQK